ncbi:hypothetical protein GXW82_02155 [Streptacidiphilus sp. 4-A2]|nr:hypothetical protein [Streptacidiphilus sp. 4-A2]
MSLLGPGTLEAEPLGYRIFGVARDKTPWRAAELIRDAASPRDLSWQNSVADGLAGLLRGRQAGLVAAATLAAATDDAPLRFSFAAAVADEARHADALYQYARAVDRSWSPARNSSFRWIRPS